MKAVRVRVAESLLLGALGFPPGTRLMWSVNDEQTLTLDLIVSHSELPEVPEAALIPRANPTFMNKDGVTTLVDWGLYKEDIGAGS